MKFGTISQNGKSQVVVRINEEYACKLSEVEELIGCTVSQDIIELICSIEKDKKLFLENGFTSVKVLKDLSCLLYTSDAADE